MTQIDRANEPRKVVRAIGEGYSIYDYPKEEARRVAERAAEQFSGRFPRVMPSIGIAVQNVPRRYIEIRGTPVLNFAHAEGGGSSGVVAETEDGKLALEFQVHKGRVSTPDGEFHRWDTELRTPDWRLITSEPELV